MKRLIYFGALFLALLCVVFYIEAVPRLHVETDFFQNDSDVIRSKRFALQNQTSDSQNMNLTSAVKSNSTDQDLVFFPDSPKIVGVPSCAQGNTFCENFESYPDKQVQQVLKNAKSNITDNPIEEQLHPKIKKLEEKQVMEDGEQPVCHSVRHVIFPKVAKNKDGKWKVIVNLNETNYSQGIQVETCSHQKNDPCEVVGELLDEFVTRCSEKFIYIKLLSLDDDGKISFDSFQLPSGCYCSYRNRYPL